MYQFDPQGSLVEVTVPDRVFATDLESLRLGAGLSLRELVRASGIPRSTLSDALAGRRFPRLDTVLAIVRVCGADPDTWRRRWVTISREERLRQPTDPPVPASPAAVPAQLPRDIAGFVSREPEMALLEDCGVTVIHGRPGVGKTALAVRWSHSVAAHYPDGQLFVNLRGHHPRRQPMSSVEALTRLLATLGVSWMPASDDPDEGSDLWRSTVARRRLLIVLDDAVTAEQVRPLLPGAQGSSVVVTSRRYLADLVVHDGADSIVLDVLPADGSVALLGRVAGPDRARAEPAAAAAVAAACGHLPLALRLAGAVLAGAPQRRFTDLEEELTAGDRLAALEGLTRPSAVESAFELSYRLLDEDARLAFRRLGIHPGPDVSVPVAALLADVDPDTANRTLRRLAEAHLIEPVRAGRYRMHDLLHAYAARLQAASGSEADRDAAWQRLCHWYVGRALAVSQRLDAGRERLRTDDQLRTSWQPDDEQALAWLDAEHANIVAVIEDDATRGTGTYAWTLVDLAAGVLSRRTDAAGLIAAIGASLAAAQQHGNDHAEGAMHLRRAWTRWRGGQIIGAASDFDRARHLLHATGMQLGEASALRGLSIYHADAGRLAQARHDAESAQAIYLATGDRFGQAATLANLAFITSRAADFTAAATYMQASLDRHREGGNRGYVALTLANLASIHLVRGEIGQAIQHAEQAVTVAREVGDGVGETTGLINAALAYGQAGAPDTADNLARHALTRARTIGYRTAEAMAWAALANASRQRGDHHATSQRARALRLIRQVGDLATESEVLLGAALDAHQHATTPPSTPAAYLAARQAAQHAHDIALAADNPHVHAQALALLAASNAGLGHLAEALVEARQAVEMHITSGARLDEITARCTLARCLYQDGDPTGAGRQWHTATEMAERLAVPQLSPVRQTLHQGLTAGEWLATRSNRVAL